MAALLDDVVAAGLLLPTSVPGIFGRGGTFEAVVEGIDRAVERIAQPDRATRVRFPPLLPVATVERTGYLRSFPDLLGVVHSFSGGDREHRELLAAFEAGDPWTGHLAATDVALCPAACHPLYPMSTGTLPADGRRYDVMGWCFRHEPSVDPARMQSFRMHEIVRLADAAGARRFRDDWIERGTRFLADELGLPVEAVPANDPFFGRAGRLLAAGQREQELKYELVVPVTSDDKPTAIASCNLHEDHFGEEFDIRAADGTVAHTACVGFGLERVTLALLRHHGTDVASWPVSVREALQL